jgi:hypothetical protein
VVSADWPANANRRKERIMNQAQQMTLAVADAIVQRRDVSWVADSTGQATATAIAKRAGGWVGQDGAVWREVQFEIGAGHYRRFLQRRNPANGQWEQTGY